MTTVAVDWDQQPLGEMPDAELGRRLGVSRERVRQMRAKRGIPAFVPPDPEWLDEVGTRPDAEIAREYGVSNETVGAWRRRLRIPTCPTHWDLEPDLGQVPDSVLAERHGVSVASVAIARWSRGIDPANPKMAAPKKRDVVWDEEPDLGRVSDEVLAERHGVTVGSVQRARKKRGIHFGKTKVR